MRIEQPGECVMEPTQSTYQVYTQDNTLSFNILLYLHHTRAHPCYGRFNMHTIFLHSVTTVSPGMTTIINYQFYTILRYIGMYKGCHLDGKLIC